MNFSVGVTLKINLSPGHIRSGTVLKYVWEDGDGRERTEMRPLGGAGRVIWRVPSALAHLTQAGWPQHTPPHTPAGLSRPRMGCRHKAEAYKCWCDVLHVPMCALSHLSPPREHKAIEGKEPHPASPGGTSHQHTAQKSATLSHVIPQQISWFFPHPVWALPTPLPPPVRVTSLSFLLLVVWHIPFVWWYNKAQPGPSPLCWALRKEEKKVKKAVEHWSKRVKEPQKMLKLYGFFCLNRKE